MIWGAFLLMQNSPGLEEKSNAYLFPAKIFDIRLVMLSPSVTSPGLYALISGIANRWFLLLDAEMC